jgi:hypothetical protein
MTINRRSFLFGAAATAMNPAAVLGGVAAAAETAGAAASPLVPLYIGRQISNALGLGILNAAIHVAFENKKPDFAESNKTVLTWHTHDDQSLKDRCYYAHINSEEEIHKAIDVCAEMDFGDNPLIDRRSELLNATQSLFGQQFAGLLYCYGLKSDVLLSNSNKHDVVDPNEITPAGICNQIVQKTNDMLDVIDHIDKRLPSEHSDGLGPLTFNSFDEMLNVLSSNLSYAPSILGDDGKYENSYGLVGCSQQGKIGVFFEMIHACCHGQKLDVFHVPQALKDQLVSENEFLTMAPRMVAQQSPEIFAEPDEMSVRWNLLKADLKSMIRSRDAEHAMTTDAVPVPGAVQLAAGCVRSVAAALDQTGAGQVSMAFADVTAKGEAPVMVTHDPLPTFDDGVFVPPGYEEELVPVAPSPAGPAQNP